jgi:hypothetical protein
MGWLRNKTREGQRKIIHRARYTTDGLIGSGSGCVVCQSPAHPHLKYFLCHCGENKETKHALTSIVTLRSRVHRTFAVTCYCLQASCIQGCYAVLSGRQLRTFRRKLLSPSSVHLLTGPSSTRLQSVTFHKPIKLN